MSKAEEFYKRLKQACDDNRQVPDLHNGRYVYIAERLDVSEEAVRKWFDDRSRPRPGAMSQLAKLLGVDELWLAHGITPDVSREQIKEWSETASGAAYVVYGLIKLAGGACAFPQPSDPFTENVDVIALISGKQKRIHVTTARPVGNNRWTFPLPREPKGLTIIGAIPKDDYRPILLDLNDPEIDKLKTKRPGGFELTVEKSGATSWVTGTHTWAPLRAL